MDGKNTNFEQRHKTVEGSCSALQSADTELDYCSVSAGKVLKIFAGREDLYEVEVLGYGGKRICDIQLLPLTDEIVREHLSGKKTLGTYIQRPNSTVKFVVIDVDISKKILLQCDRSSEIFSSYLKKAFGVANKIRKLYRSWGLEGYIEYSGNRGYHVWLLFTEWIPVRYANMFCDVLLQQLNLQDEEITLEFFPNKTRIKAGKYGQALKLPFGRHIKTHKLSYFIDTDGERIDEVNSFLDSIAHFQLSAIKKILAENTSISCETQTHQVDDNISYFENLDDNVKEVLEKCNLMRYLCQKAHKTGYLSHFERLSILYVFGHLGEEGKKFVHQVMNMTMNYQYNVTEKFITRLPGKPISCLKLREQYKNLTAEFGCSCTFKRSKNCYPSPVLHALALSKDATEDITIPTSRTLTKENSQKVIEDLNIHKKSQELAVKILEYKKQSRKLNSSISKLEAELGSIYDNEGVDCLEIDMGLLVRRKKENGWEWIIEI